MFNRKGTKAQSLVYDYILFKNCFLFSQRLRAFAV